MATKDHKKYKQFRQGILCSLCLFVALSFLAALVPIVVAANNSNAMPCCVGKSGHCDSGIAAKKPPQPKEPMCGLHEASTEDDGITIVAEPSHTESHHSLSRTGETASTEVAAESASLSKPCRMECGVCAGISLRLQKRERAIVHPTTLHGLSISALSRYDTLPLLFSSNDDWKSPSPRGPPADLL